MSGLVRWLVQWAEPWARVYRDSGALQSGVAFLHFGGMIVAGGFAIAMDRATIRASRATLPDRARQLAELREVHRIIMVALAVTFASGFLLLGADVEAIVTSKVFWLKMTLIGLLILNGWVMVRAELRLRNGSEIALGPWQALRIASRRSLALWFAVVLAGSMLPNVG